MDRLTPRETEVLRLIAEGKAAKQIAFELGISDKTVEFHRANLTRKLGAMNTADLVCRAVRAGVIDVFSLAGNNHPIDPSDPLPERIRAGLQERNEYRRALADSLSKAQKLLERARSARVEFEAVSAETRRRVRELIQTARGGPATRASKPDSAECDREGAPPAESLVQPLDVGRQGGQESGQR